MFNQTCSRCHYENAKGNLFCAQCGNSLGAAETVKRVTRNTTELGPDFGWPLPEQVNSSTLQHSESLKREPVDAARCPQCSSPQTQSFEMAYSMSISSGSTTGAAYTFGVGPTIAGARSTQQSNLASYVRPPIRPTANYGCAIAILAILGAGLASGIIGSLFESALTPDALAAIRALVFIGALIGLILVGVNYQNQKRREWAGSYTQAYEEWRHWWICLRCGNRWRR